MSIEADLPKWLAFALACFSATCGWFFNRLSTRVDNIEKIRLEIEHGYGPIYEKINDLAVTIEGLRVEVQHACEDIKEIKERERHFRKGDIPR